MFVPNDWPMPQPCATATTPASASASELIKLPAIGENNEKNTELEIGLPLYSSGTMAISRFRDYAVIGQRPSSSCFTTISP